MGENTDTNYKVLELVIAEQSITDRPYWTHVENEDLDYDFDFNEAERVFNALVKQGRDARLVKVTTEVLQENNKGQGIMTNKKETQLTLEIIESYGFEKVITKPDWDDVQNTYTLPNGIELVALTVSGNEPCKVNSLEGLDGWIFIKTKRELDEILGQTAEQVLRKLAEDNDEFDFNEYW